MKIGQSTKMPQFEHTPSAVGLYFDDNYIYGIVTLNVKNIKMKESLQISIDDNIKVVIGVNYLLKHNVIWFSDNPININKESIIGIKFI